MPEAMIVFVQVWPQLFLLFFVCLWPGDFLSLFFLLKIFLFPTLLVSCSFREQLGAAQPSCFASAAHTSYLFSKNKGKLEYHITPYKTTPFLNNYSHKQGLLSRALATFGGWAKYVQSEAVCLKQSLAVASSLPFHWSLKAVRLPTTGSIRFQLRLIHPPISIIQEARSIFDSQQIKTQCKTFAPSTSNVF